MTQRVVIPIEPIYSMKKLSLICYTFVLLMSPSLTRAQSLSPYQSTFNLELQSWANSFEHFHLSDFKQAASGKFENTNPVQAKNRQQFYPAYKPALSTSRNGRLVLDIYSYLLLDQHQGRLISTGTDVEQSILLGNISTKKWMQIAYYGYTQRVQEVCWVNNDTFILAAARINKLGRGVPVIIVGHIGQQSLTVFESINSNCYQKKLGYASPKLAALHIKHD
jgi:hypothetical protein